MPQEKKYIPTYLGIIYWGNSAN